ncbi:interferon-induced GTP-binding protein Mx-like [Oncorhynchus clarkii lewisi]|uniref:interferon-induced GTP-binding protein Mx-like n=1 Tax=Oncorhynchus clarkii lewisi TaxID=490388 RepID=UPI0039B893A3
MGVNTSLCNWILDFLTGRCKVVTEGNNTSATLILNTGAPQGRLDRQVRPFIELIDFQRSTGIEKDLTLPAIAVVCIVTRCLLELKLRKSFGGKWKVKISYQGIVETFEDPSLVEIQVRTAQNTLAGDGVGICDDLITLEITSPDVCDLTLIDLPGITTVPFKDQPEDIGDQMKTDKIHLNQEAKVEKKIKEYTNMEPLVYGQDTIFVKGLKDHEDHFKEAFEEEQFNDPDEIEDKNTTATFNCAVFDTTLWVYY